MVTVCDSWFDAAEDFRGDFREYRHRMADTKQGACSAAITAHSEQCSQCSFNTGSIHEERRLQYKVKHCQVKAAQEIMTGVVNGG